MNAEATRYNIACTEEDARIGSVAATRLQALQKLRLKTVVKESHCSPVHQLLFNSVDPQCGNLLASLGKTQATIYDDLHMGSFIGVVVHFTNEVTEHACGGGLQACAWLNARSWSPHTHGDACLAVAGEDPNISVISVAEARITHLLQGHRREVVQLGSATAAPGLLASLARDGELRTWDVPSSSCTSCSPSVATSMAVHPDGSCIVTGGRRGALHCWSLPSGPATGPSSGVAAANGSSAVAAAANGGSEAAAGGAGAAPPDLRDACKPLHMQGGGHTDTVDRMLFLSAERLATRSSDGRVCVWDWPQQQLVTTWKVPHSVAGCGFNATADGAFICAGNTRGGVHVYEARDGSRIASMASDKVAAPVEACALSNDCRHLLAAAGKGFVFRYEHNPRHAAAAQDGDKENSDANVAEDSGGMADGGVAEDTAMKEAS